MENEPDRTQQPAPVKTKKKWNRGLGGFIVSGLIYAFAQESFNKSGVDAAIILAVALGAWPLYYFLKSKIRESEWVRIVVAFLIIEIIAGFLIGFSIRMTDRFSATAVGAPSLAPTAVKKDVNQESPTAPTGTLNYDALINDALSNLQTKQGNLETVLSTSKYTSYKYSALLGQLVFTDPSTNDRLTAEVQDIGGLAPDKDGKETWMWSWANDSVPSDMAKDSSGVKQFGTIHNQEIRNAPTNKALLGRNPLTEGVFISDDVDALDLTAVTLYLAGGEGIYKVPFTNDNGNAVEYLLIKDFLGR